MNFETLNQENIKIENDIECLFEHPLSDDQILLSKSIFDNVFKSIRTPKLVQLISQPQTGKTNTILNILGLIGNYSHNNPKFESRGFLTVFFQPSDNVLKKQLEDRLTYKYKDKLNKNSHKIITNLEIGTSGNISGMRDKISKKIEDERKDSKIIGFIHDESHCNIGNEQKLPNFYHENNIFLVPLDKKEYQKNENKENEIYMNISASPSSFVEYMKNSNDGYIDTYYLKPHNNYLSFKDIHDQGRFKKGFNLNDKNNNFDFIKLIICDSFLKGEEGCLIVRIENKNIFLKLRDELNECIKNPIILQEKLENLNLLQEDFKKILKNFQKLKTYLFSSNGIEMDEEKKLLNDHDNFKIKNMNYFLENKSEDYKILFIMDSFLQGKTLNLDNVRGWFERYNENPYNNNAFTIQSVGRNCGNYKNKNYEYPIWVNLDEIRHIINFYDIVSEHVETDGRISSRLWNNINNKISNVFITNTYTKEKSQKKKIKEFEKLYVNEFNSYKYEADCFSSYDEAIYFIDQKLNDANINRNNQNISVSKVSENNVNNVIGDIILKSYGRYSKTTSSSGGYQWGIIHIDDLNQNHFKSWNEYVLNDKNSILFNKKDYYISYVTRINVLNEINETFVTDSSVWRSSEDKTLNDKKQINLEEVKDIYLNNFIENKENLKNIQEFNSVLFHEKKQLEMNKILIKNPKYMYSVFLNIFEQLKIIDEKVYEKFIKNSDLNLINGEKKGNIINDEQIYYKFSEYDNYDNIQKCLINSLKEKIKDEEILKFKLKKIEKLSSIHRIPDGFVINLNYSASNDCIEKCKNDKNKIACIIENFKKTGINFYKNDSDVFIENFDNIKFKFIKQ